jgi:hypothetical protein
MGMTASDVLGVTFIDKVTKFRGVATGYASYLTGCAQALLIAEAKDGKSGAAQWIDVQRLDRDDSVPRIVIDNGATPGCDAPAPIR